MFEKGQKSLFGGWGAHSAQPSKASKANHLLAEKTAARDGDPRTAIGAKNHSAPLTQLILETVSGESGLFLLDERWASRRKGDPGKGWVSSWRHQETKKAPTEPPTQHKKNKRKTKKKESS